MEGVGGGEAAANPLQKHVSVCHSDRREESHSQIVVFIFLPDNNVIFLPTLRSYYFASLAVQ
jgi:hypothetical protein